MCCFGHCLQIVVVTTLLVHSLSCIQDYLTLLDIVYHLNECYRCDYGFGGVERCICWSWWLEVHTWCEEFIDSTELCEICLRALVLHLIGNWK